MLRFRIFVWLLLGGGVSAGVFGGEPEPGAQPPAREEYLLRYRFQKGEVLRWNVLQSLKIRTSVKGREEFVETSSRSAKIWTVLDIAADGSVTFEYKVDDVLMRRFQTDQEEAKYNSRKDETIPLSFSNLEGRIGVPLSHLTIDALGATKKKVNLLEYFGSAQENRIVIPLPEEPIAIGEHWFVNIPIEIRQKDGTVKKVVARQKFTLENVRLGVAKIKFATQILTVLDPRSESQILDKYSSGEMELDLDAGHIIRQQTTVDKMVVGFQGQSDNIHHQSRFTECCCGLTSCELCSFEY